MSEIHFGCFLFQALIGAINDDLKLRSSLQGESVVGVSLIECKMDHPSHLLSFLHFLLLSLLPTSPSSPFFPLLPPLLPLPALLSYMYLLLSFPHSSTSSSLQFSIQQQFGAKAPIMFPDKSVTMCQVCSAHFTFTSRRHHCRACGKVCLSVCLPVFLLVCLPLSVCLPICPSVCFLCVTSFTQTFLPTSGGVWQVFPVESLPGIHGQDRESVQGLLPHLETRWVQVFS